VIDLKVKVLGGPEIAATLTSADTEIRDAIRAEMSRIGEEIRDRARALAPRRATPTRRRTISLADRIISYFGQEMKRGPKGAKRLTPVDTKWKDGRLRLTVRPTGRVAHLMERGVNATFQQRTGRGSGAGQVTAGITSPKWKEARSLTYQRSMIIDKRPFFMPAVAAAGGASGVNARLQARIDFLAQKLSRGRAA
jgi:hypothetical protein